MYINYFLYRSGFGATYYFVDPAYGKLTKSECQWIIPGTVGVDD